MKLIKIGRIVLEKNWDEEPRLSCHYCSFEGEDDENAERAMMDCALAEMEKAITRLREMNSPNKSLDRTDEWAKETAAKLFAADHFFTEDQVAEMFLKASKDAKARR